MRSESELRDLVDSLVENAENLSFEEVEVAAEELEKQLKQKRAEIKKAKKEPKKRVRRGIGSY